MELMQRKLRYLNDSSFRLYHLCYYFSSSVYWDDDRRRVLAFKNLNEMAIRNFISKSINFLLDQKMEKDMIIIRALNSKEMVANSTKGTALDRLGRSLASTFGCSYLPEILQKKTMTGALKSLSVPKRQAVLSDIYKLAEHSINLNDRKVLLIDDVVTTGLTSCSIMKAILTVYPRAKVSVFALAWTPTKDQQSYLMNQQDNSMLVREPEVQYGKRNKIVLDRDFEKGKTNISLF